MLRFAVFNLILTAVVATAVAAGVTRGLAQPSQSQSRVPLGTAFTYQGRIVEGGVPADGAYDVQARLYADVSGNVIVPGTSAITREDVDVTNGLFQVSLDFGLAAFNGDQRFIEVRLRPSGSIGGYVVLEPLVALTATPYAIWALTAPWTGLTNVPSGFADGVDGDTLAGLPCSNGEIAQRLAGAWACGQQLWGGYTAAPGGGLSLTGTAFSVDTSVIQRRVTPGCSPNSSIRAINADGTVVCDPDDVGGQGESWSLSGNPGTVAGTNFIGTTDHTPLEFRVNSQRVMRIQSGDTGPNIVAGPATNSLGTSVGSSVIGGGRSNEIYYFDNNVIAGGESNVISLGSSSVISGGYDNTNSAVYGTISGGRLNVINTGVGGTISGGEENWVSHNLSTVSGGASNRVTGAVATIPGGMDNTVDGNYSFAAGTGATVEHDYTFAWDGDPARAVSSARSSTFLIGAANGVGINTNLPYGALDVGGDARFRGNNLNHLAIEGAGDDMSLTLTKTSESVDPSARILFNGYTDSSTHRALIEFHTRGAGDGTAIVRAVIEEAGHLRPGVNSTSGSTGYSLGTSSFRWREVWAQDGSINTSDARLKTNIMQLEPGLAEVLLLRPVSYAWKDGDPSERRIGLLAQDVRDVLPSVVRGSAQTGFGMNYDELIPLLVKAIQEQQQQIGALSGTSPHGSERWRGAGYALGLVTLSLTIGIIATRRWSLKPL